MGVLHVGPEGRVLEPTAAGLLPGIELSLDAQLGAGEAIEIAVEAMSPRSESGRTTSAREIVYPVLRRVNLAPGKARDQLNALDLTSEVAAYRHAWLVRVKLDNWADGVAQWDVVIDATTGEVLESWDALQVAATQGVGNSQYSGTVSLDTWHDPYYGLYELRETTRAQGDLLTVDAGQMDPEAGWYPPTQGFLDYDNVWGDGQTYAGGSTTGENGQTAAVDAHYGMQVAWDYLQTIHGWWGIDGQGTPVYARVHVGYLYDNAYWSDDCFCMSFGDGSFPVDPFGLKPLVTLDVLAHELAHGLTGQTARLIYAGESGGLNEATSDIVAAMTESWHGGGMGPSIGDTGGDWTVGEDLRNFPLRYMYKPSLDGYSADAWFDGIDALDVHESSGPMNRAFVFLADGADPATSGSDHSSPWLPDGMAGVGKDAAAAIWFRALSVYLFSSAGYAEARTAALHAAADLYGMGSAEFRAVQDAFAAINVGYSAATFDDLQAPSVSLAATGTSPLIRLEAAAVDNVGVAQVEFYVGGMLADTLYAPPFVLELDTRAWGSGLYEAYAVAVDHAGHGATSSTVAIQVSLPWTQLIQNPGFEDGNLNWASYPLDFMTFGDQAAFGYGYAALGGVGLQSELENRITQAVTIPNTATRASLSLWFAMLTEESDLAPYDSMTVHIWNGLGGYSLASLHEFTNMDVAGMWRQASFDLSAFIGKNIFVGVIVEEDDGNPTMFLVDEFALHVSSHPDTTPPLAHAYVYESGEDFQFGVSTQDDGHIAGVDFLIDGVSQGVQAPAFGMRLPRASFAPGSHVFEAVVTDGAGNQTTTDPAIFTVEAPRVELVQNGGFEDTGPSGMASWPTSGSGVQVVTDPDFSYAGWSALYFGNDQANQSAAHQVVTLPASGSSAILRFAMELHADAPNTPNRFEVRLLDGSGNLLETLEAFGPEAQETWVERAYDLTGYLGQTVGIAFYADLPDALGAFWVLVDEVSLIVRDEADQAPPQVSASVRSTVGGFQLEGAATDDTWVAELRFFVDGALVHTVQEPGEAESHWFDAAGLAVGLHELEVEAEDIAGNVGAAAVDFMVEAGSAADTQRPAVALSTSGAPGALTIQATASDDTGVFVVEFFVNDALAARIFEPPYALDFDGLGLPEALHEVRALAWDAYGKSGEATLFVDTRPISIDPEAVALAVGETVVFRATVADPQDTVHWSVGEEASCGSVDAAGLYTAPEARALCHVVASVGARAPRRRCGSSTPTSTMTTSWTARTWGAWRRPGGPPTRAAPGSRRRTSTATAS